MPFCPRCKAWYEIGATHCQECGAPLNSTQTGNYILKESYKKHSVGFYFIMASGIIVGLFAGVIVIGLIFTTNWVAEIFSQPTPLNAATILLSGVLILAAFFITWRAIKLLQAKWAV